MEKLFKRLREKAGIIQLKKINFTPLNLNNKLKDFTLFESKDIPFSSMVFSETVPGEPCIIGESQQKLAVYPKHVKIENRDKKLYYHIAWCKHVQRAHENNSYEQYYTTRRDDGKFLVNLYKDHKLYQKNYLVEMNVCKECLSELNYKNYRVLNANTGFMGGRIQRKKAEKIYDTFRLKDYFKDNNSDLKIVPKDHGASSKENKYPSNWNDISFNYRSSKQWKCEKCGVDCSDVKKYLDAHHINGRKDESLSFNLKALCKECHAAVHKRVMTLEERKLRTQLRNPIFNDFGSD